MSFCRPKGESPTGSYLELHYDQLYSGISGTAQKSGNISQLVWRTRGRDRQAYTRYEMVWEFLTC